MKDRKRIWDRRNIDTLEDEVKKFFHLNTERFKVKKEKKTKKRPKAEMNSILEVEDLAANSKVGDNNSVLGSTLITYEETTDKSIC